MIKSCATCRFWQCISVGEEGLCRQSSPFPETRIPSSDYKRAHWSQTRGVDWCGDWALRIKGPFEDLTLVQVIADFVEEEGEQKLAEKIRREFSDKDNDFPE